MSFIDTTALKKFLMQQLKTEVDDDLHDGYTHTKFKPPTGRTTTKCIGPWLWIKTRLVYKGAKWGPTTDRHSGDPYSAHVQHEWIGLAESVPAKVSRPRELNRWALFATTSGRTYRDIQVPGPWGTHSGGRVKKLTKDGEMKVQVVSSRTFRDVSPESMTKIEHVKLKKIKAVSFAPLVKALDDDNASIRQGAAMSLGKLGDARAIGPLIRLLVDEWLVRVKAIAALVTIGEPAVKPLLKALENDHSLIRAGAVESLGEIGDSRAIEPLVKALADENLAVRSSAAGVLESSGWQPSNSVEEAHYLLAKSDWENLVALGKPAVAPLIKALEDEDRNVRYETARALGELKDKGAVEPLIKALNEDESRHTREEAARSLGKLSDARAIEPLIKALGDKEWLVSHDVAKALVTFGVLIVEPLIQELANENQQVREQAAFALGELDDPRAVEPLITLLTDEHYRTRRAAARSLGELGDIKAVEPLINALTDENKGVQTSAARALGHLGDIRAIEPLIIASNNSDHAFRRAAEKALHSLVSIGAPAVTLLLDILGKPGAANLEENVLASYLDFLLRLKPSLDQLVTIKPFLQSVIKKDTSNEVKRITKNLLKPLELLKNLSSRDARVKLKAAKKLGRLRYPQTVEPLIKALGDDDVKVTVEGALAEMGETALEPLVKALDDKNENEQVREGAARTLGRLRDIRAVEPLIEALEDSNRIVRKNATWALEQLKAKRAFKALVKAMGDEYPPVRENAACALGTIGMSRAIKPLTTAMSDESRMVRLAAIDSLASIAGRLKTPLKAIEALTLALSDDDERIRKAAERYIHYLKHKEEEKKKRKRKKSSDQN